jgi:hypothetical protein
MDLRVNNYCVEIDGDEYCVDVIVNAYIGNDGIGSYEYWGATGFDKGMNYVEEFTIEDILLNDKTIEDANLFSRISKMLEESDSFSQSVDEAFGKYDEEDYRGD